MNYTEGQLSKLPKWARNHILHLQDDVAEMEKRLKQGPEDSRVFADPHSDEARPLGNAYISFRFPKEEGSAVENEITVNITPANRLRVSGSDTILVLPSSNNSVEIVPVDWSNARALTEPDVADRLYHQRYMRERSE